MRLSWIGFPAFTFTGFNHKAVGVYSSWVKRDKSLKTALPAHCASPGGACPPAGSSAQQLSGWNKMPALRHLSLPLSTASDALLCERCCSKAAAGCSQLCAGPHWCCRLLAVGFHRCGEASSPFPVWGVPPEEGHPAPPRSVLLSPSRQGTTAG